MDFESAEECHEYNKKQLLDRDDSDYFLLLERLLRQIPDEFRDNKIFNSLKERHLKEENYIKKLVLIEREKSTLAIRLEKYRLIISCLEQDEKVKIESPWELEGEYTVSNSIFSNFEGETGWVQYDFPFTVWFEEAINLFNAIKKHFDRHLGSSLKPKHLAKIEIKNLNTFFDTGKYVSKSIYSPIVNKAVYEYYTGLLWGETLWIGCSGDVLTGRMDKLERSLTKGGKNKIAILADVMQEDLEEDWFSSINVQALLWLKNYLEELEEADIKKICLKNHRKNLFSDVVKAKKGFKVVKPEIIPTLYKVLGEYGLVDKEEEGDFENAIQNGVGVIDWQGNQRQLGSFVHELVNKYSYHCQDKWIVAAGIFLIEGKPQKANGIKGGNSGKQKKDIDLIEDIFQKITMKQR